MPRPLGVMLFTCVAAAPAALAHAQGVVLLPEAGLRLAAIRYAETEPQFKWSGWIGGGLGLVRLGGAVLRVDADVETIIGAEKRAFDANQANYHLEASGRGAWGATEVQVFYHHVSRHLVDRPKTQAVDWNVLGVRVGRRIAGALPVRVRVGVGRATLASLVGYRWELTGRAQAERALGGRASTGALYADADLRFVEAEASAAFPRDSFLDARLEAGLRLRRGERQASLFAAFERRNDVFLLEPGARSRVLFGLRLGLSE